MTSTVATVVVSQVEAPPEKTVDREKVCPLLLRIFVANGRHNPIVDYAHGAVPANELQIYTWMDCSLNELTGLIKEVNPDSRRRGTVFDFSIVAPDRMRPPHYAMREIGNTMNGQRGVDDAKTLDQCKFVIGDFVDVAITLPAFEGRGGPPFSRGGRYNYRGLPRHNGELGEGGSGEDRGGFGGGRGDFDGERGSFGGRGGGFGGGRGNFDGERGNFGGRGGGFGGGRGGFGFRRGGGFVRDRSPMERDRF